MKVLIISADNFEDIELLIPYYRLIEEGTKVDIASIGKRNMKGKHVTSYQSVADEMRDAGAIYEDKEVVVDGNLLTSRQPSDLPFFLRETMKILKGE